MTKCATYARVSTDKQSREKGGVSLDAQQRLTDGYAATKGYSLDPAHRYVDVDSGGELDRPDLLKLIAAAKRHEFAVVVVDVLDRWCRDEDARGYFAILLRQAGVRLEFVNAKYEPNTFHGGMMMSMDGRVAELERARNSERGRKVFRERLEQGKGPMRGSAPYGYEKEPIPDDPQAVRHLLRYEPEAVVVRRIFLEAAGGHSANSIRQQLNLERVPPPSANPNKGFARRGTQWSTGQVCAMLRDTIYMGQRACGRQRSLAVDVPARIERVQQNLADTLIVARPKDEWEYLNCPAIVDGEVWLAAQDTVSSRRADRTRNETRPALLRGMARCQCGRPLQPQFYPSGKIAYRCSSRKEKGVGSCGSGSVPETIEDEVWDIVLKFTSDPIAAAEELRRAAEQKPDTGLLDEVQRINQALTNEDRRLARLTDLFADGNEELQVGKDKVAAAKRAIALLTERREELERQIAAQAAEHGHLSSLVDYIQHRYRDLKDASFSEKRRLLDDLGVKVVGRKPKKNGSAIVSITATIPAVVAAGFREKAELDREVQEALGQIGSKGGERSLPSSSSCTSSSRASMSTPCSTIPRCSRP